jgi:hypothetical protein
LKYVSLKVIKNPEKADMVLQGAVPGLPKDDEPF